MIEKSHLIPVSSLFILLLIIGGNYLGVLFPCQLQDILEHNILVKHFLAFLTLVFFAVLSDSENGKTLKDVLKSSILLYFWFILIIRMNAKFFLILVFTIAIIYILKLYKKELDDEKDKIKLDKINKIINILFVFSILITIIGFLIYYFEKKIEYKKDFNNFTFFFGKVNCRHYSPDLSLKEIIKEAKKQLSKP